MLKMFVKYAGSVTLFRVLTIFLPCCTNSHHFVDQPEIIPVTEKMIELADIAGRSNLLKVLTFFYDNPEYVFTGSEDRSIIDLYHTALEQAILIGDLSSVGALLSRKFDINHRSSKCGSTLLHNALHIRDDIMVNFLLNQKNININLKDNNGDMPLHIAAKRNYFSMFNRLISRGADINAKNNKGFTPLHIASFRNNVQMISLLLAQPGIEVNLQDEKGCSPLHHLVILWADVEAANLFLARDDIQVNLKEINANTPLHFAAFRESFESVSRLLEMGAELNIQDLQGNTPLHMAAMKGNSILVRELRNKGARLAVYNKYNKTPMQLMLRCINRSASRPARRAIKPELAKKVFVGEDAAAKILNLKASLAKPIKQSKLGKIPMEMPDESHSIVDSYDTKQINEDSLNTNLFNQDDQQSVKRTRSEFEDTSNNMAVKLAAHDNSTLKIKRIKLEPKDEVDDQLSKEIEEIAIEEEPTLCS